MVLSVTVGEGFEMPAEEKEEEEEGEEEEAGVWQAGGDAAVAHRLSAARVLAASVPYFLSCART